MHPAYVEGIGVLGPGIQSWQEAAYILKGERTYVPGNTVLSPPESLPPAERRRASRGVMAALQVGYEACAMAGVLPAEPASVFASSGSDGDICNAICSAVAAGDHLISPTQFHNSVHNAISGYWGIATGAMAPSSVVSAHDGSFAAGLLEAVSLLVTLRTPVLLVASDQDYPFPLYATRPVPDIFAVALILTVAPQPGKSLAQIRIASDQPFTEMPGQTMSEVPLADLSGAIPAARCLPLLQSIARRDTGNVVLEYLDSQYLVLEVAPC
ncbi:MAG: beta-ketoacyl synthase chain length factor [Acidithiobacillus sp.]